MSTNLQDITLQSADEVLIATNEAGHLTYPMVHLNRQPTADDARLWDAMGFDRVLVFVDGDGSLRVNPAAIYLNEENNYFQSLYIQTEGHWQIEGVIEEYIQLESSSGQLEGVGNTRIDITKASTLATRGEYTCFFTVVLTSMEGTEIRIPVYITVNVPLTVNGNNGTLTINLNQSNNYTQLLTVIRDREWALENVNTDIIHVSPSGGNGQDLPGFASTLTVTKSPHLNTTTATTTFQIVSVLQRVNVIVNITVTATLEFVDPLPGEAGVAGTSDIYLYL